MQLSNRETFHSIVPYSSHVAEGVVSTICNDFVASWQLEGIAAEVESSLNLDITNYQTHNFLKSFSGENVSIYVHVIRQKVKDSFQGSCGNYFADTVNHLYYSGLEAATFRKNTIYFSLVYSPYSKMENSNLNKLTAAAKKESLEVQLKTMNEYCENITYFLKRFGGTRLTAFTNEKNITFSQQLMFYNFLISGAWQKIPLSNSPIYNQIGTADVYFAGENGQIKVFGENKFFRSIEVKEFPQSSTNLSLESILIADCDFVLTQSFSCLQKRAALSAVRRVEKLLRATSSDAYEQREALTEAKNELVEGSMFLGDYHFSLLIYGSSIDEMIKNTNKQLTILSDSGFIPVLSEHSLVASFCAQLPGLLKLRPRLAPINSRNFVDFASLHNYESGKRDKNCWGQAIAILKTPNKQPYYLNLHDSNINKDEFGEKNLANTCVIGTSGSGKTMLLSFLQIMLQKYNREDSFDINAHNKNLTTIFLDKDRGAEINIKALGGEYFIFKNGLPTGWNPFQLENTNENKAFLKALIRLLCQKSGEVLTAREQTQISDCVESVMLLPQAKRHYGITLCIQNLSSGVSREAKVNDLVMRLTRWSREGEYGWIFDNRMDSFKIDHCTNFGFDGTEFLDKEDIRSPISFYILHRITELLDGRRVAIFMDEFWKWISDPVFADFAYNKLKTIRKLNGFIVAATQSPDEILKSEISRAVVEICATQIFLANPKASLKDYIDGFGVSAEEYEIIKNIDPHSRTFLIKKTSLQGNSKPFSALVQLDLKNLGRYTKILSSSSDNLSLFNNVYKEGQKPEEWIEEYLGVAV